jgi:hypothetical protein
MNTDFWSHGQKELLEELKKEESADLAPLQK